MRHGQQDCLTMSETTKMAIWEVVGSDIEVKTVVFLVISPLWKKSLRFQNLRFWPLNRRFWAPKTPYGSGGGAQKYSCQNLKFWESRSLHPRKIVVQSRTTRELTCAVERTRGVDSFRYLGWLLTPNRWRGTAWWNLLFWTNWPKVHWLSPSLSWNSLSVCFSLLNGRWIFAKNSFPLLKYKNCWFFINIIFPTFFIWEKKRFVFCTLVVWWVETSEPDNTPTSYLQYHGFWHLRHRTQLVQLVSYS